MPTFSFDGFSTGSAVAITVAQAGLTDSGSVAAWGQTGGVANIGILTVSQPTVTAPAGVWFEAIDISGFDVNGGPGPGEVYDPSFHGITFIWTVRDNPLPPYMAPGNMIPAWNDANRAYGKKVAFAFPNPGSYTVDLWAVDASGNTATAETTVTVVNPDTVYPGTRTVCFSNDPGETWADEASGCVRATNMAAVQSILSGSSVPLRILFKADQTVEDFALDIQPGKSVAHVGRWGSGADPILHMLRTDRIVEIYGEGVTQLTFVGLDFRGEWDPTAELGHPTPSPFYFRQQSSGTFTSVIDCRFAGFTSLTTQQKRDQSNVFLIANTVITDWRDYGIYHGDEDIPTSRLAIIGSRITQNPDALNGGHKNGLFNTHGPIRYSQISNVYLGVLDLFSRVGWSGLGNDTADQPCLRANTSGGEGRALILDRVVAEGGYRVLMLAGQNGGTNGTVEMPCNMLLDKVLMIGTAKNIGSFMFAEFGGTTIRNTIGILPDTPRWHGNGWEAAVDLTPDNPDPANGVQPMAIYGATFVSLLESANDPGWPWPLQIGDTAFTTVTLENNVLHAPTMDTAVDGDAPIDLSTAVPGVTPRYKGVRFNFESVSGTFSADVPNGGSFTVPYAQITTDLVRQSGGAVTDQAYWQAIEATDTRHMIGAGSDFWQADQGEIAVAFEASAVRITNLSGETWPNGENWSLRLDRASLIPSMQTAFASPASVPLPRPGATSPAADSGDLGFSPYDDFLGEARPAANRARGALTSQP